MGNSNSSKAKEEIVSQNPLNEIVKHFVKENAIVWHDPEVHSSQNTAYISELKNICDVHMFSDWKEASAYLKETSFSYCQVITSETNGELLVKDVFNLPNVPSIYVFNSDSNSPVTWTDQYPKIVSVENDFVNLLNKMKQSMITWQRTSSSLRIALPNFSPISDDINQSEMDFLHFYLQGLVNFTNRQQAQGDFITLAKELYGTTHDIEEFEKKYDHYDTKNILNWYNKESFLYKITNNCLKTAKSDPIHYCRLILKDLENAIKDEYQQSSHKFSGFLYKGKYLSNDEWTRLQQSINKDIEIHGFLLTTKQKEVALNFCQTNVDKKVMITLIVPNIPDKRVQGFAELKEYSEFPGEDEVLFNVRSRFTVIEANLEKINGVEIRHLVLFYGAHALKRYTTIYNPVIQIEISSSKLSECKGCKQNFSTSTESLIAINIRNADEYLCKHCMRKSQPTNGLILLCVSPAPEKDNTSLKIEGTVLQYQDHLNIPFYDYKCVACQGTRLNCCYKCVDCKDARKIYCDSCLHDQSNNCMKERHLMILEGSSFSFWSEKLSESELHYLEFLEEGNKETEHLVQQTKVSQYTFPYQQAAIDNFQKYLKENGDLENEQVAVSYNDLGNVHYILGEYQQAIGNYSKALEISKEVLGDKHRTLATSYSNLGSVYKCLGEYEKALEHHSKALEIRREVLGEKHPSAATSYSNTGSVYGKIGEYQKALEYHSKALEIKKEVLGENHPSTADSYSSFGSTFASLGEFQKAMELHSKALEIYKTVFGDKHPYTATSYNELGLAYTSCGVYQKALEYHSKALEIRKIAFGNKHPETATSYENLGGVHFRSGKYQKAAEYFSESLDINKEVLGEKHPDTATSYNNLGLTYDHLGDYKKAVEYNSKALEISKELLGDQHPSIATSYNNLGTAYDNVKEYQKAIECHSKALEIRKTVFGDLHSETATSYHNLGLALKNMKEYKQAVEYFSKALEIRQTMLGDYHPHTTSTYDNLESSKKMYEKSLKK